MPVKIEFASSKYEEKEPNTGGPRYQLIAGYDHKFTADISPDSIISSMKYKPTDDDLFIVTYPKNGTTWTQQILTLLLNNGEVPEEVKKNGLYARSPFMELQGEEGIKATKRPCAIKSHLPGRLQPWNSKAKYVIVIRNPKDVAVSYYHHTQLFDAYQFKGRSFDEFFEYFLAGEIESGCYFDWTLEWWRLRNEPNVKFFLYEDMKRDTRGQILELAEFVLCHEERELLLAQGEEGLNKIIRQSTVGFMKETTNESLRDCFKIPKDANFNFIRKGVIGDWRSTLNEEQNRAIEEKFQEKFKGTGLAHLWDKYGFFDRK